MDRFMPNPISDRRINDARPGWKTPGFECYDSAKRKF